MATETSASTQDEVRAEYHRRLAEAVASAELTESAEVSLANVRLTTFAVGLVLAVVAAEVEAVSGWWLLPVVGVFAVLVVRHDRLRRRRRRAERRGRFYERGLDRVCGRWAGKGDRGADFLDASHAYSEHLDVFGKGSLFELICTARTPRGRTILARWLAAPACPDEVRMRQAAVAELRPRLDLREDVALLGGDAASGANLVHLPAWGSAAVTLEGVGLRIVAFALPAAAIGALAAWWVVDLSFLVFLGIVVLEAVFFRIVRDRVGPVLAAAETPANELDLLAGILGRLESEDFESPRLRDLSAALAADDRPASACIAALRHRMDLLDAARNQFFAPIAGLLLWSVHLAFSLESWRRRCGPAVEGWLESVGQIEALSSISGYAFEHPVDPFPEFLDGDGVLFDCEGLGHPLLLEDACVRNDLCVDRSHRVFVVSGSNMSGKSTLLRTVGVNAVLAQAGAPVRATSLRLRPLTVGASIHVHDSLLDGESRFYAEVSRIGHIVALSRESDRPLLFLLDELFHGTNSHDRRIGAAAVVRTLLDGGAVGFLTTHDLELARIAEDLDAHVVNVHFEDRFEDGRMTFDYRMRPGVVERSNALALMRAVGLDV